MAVQIGQHLRRYLVTGIFVLAPLTVTAYLLFTGFSIVDRLLGTVVAQLVGHNIPGIGALLTLLLTLMVGMVATNVMGRRLIAFGEALFARIPIVRAVYLSVKQLVDAFSVESMAGFRRVVMIEYPRRGIWSIGFVTSKGVGQLHERFGDDYSTVFIPTSPNPTSGFMLAVPDRDLVPLDMPVETAFKIIVSGGIVLASGNQPGEDQSQ